MRGSGDWVLAQRCCCTALSALMGAFENSEAKGGYMDLAPQAVLGAFRCRCCWQQWAQSCKNQDRAKGLGEWWMEDGKALGL